MSGQTVFEQQESTTSSGIHYRVTRSATSVDPLVLVYGYGGNMGMWPMQLIERLANSFVVVCIDNRGAGQSICPLIPAEYSVEIMASDVDDVVRALNVASFHLLGYSLGGCIALQYAHMYEHKLKSLFLLATSGGGTLWSAPDEDYGATLAVPPGDTLWERYVAVWKTTMSEETLQKYEPTLRELFENSKDYITPNEALAGHLHAFRNFSSRQFLGQLTIPMTILAGTNDRLIPVQNSINLAAELPHATFIQVPGCQHYPQVEALDLLATQIETLCTSA